MAQQSSLRYLVAFSTGTVSQGKVQVCVLLGSPEGERPNRQTLLFAEDMLLAFAFRDLSAAKPEQLDYFREQKCQSE